MIAPRVRKSDFLSLQKKQRRIRCFFVFVSYFLLKKWNDNGFFAMIDLSLKKREYFRDKTKSQLRFQFCQYFPISGQNRLDIFNLNNPAYVNDFFLLLFASFLFFHGRAGYWQFFELPDIPNKSWKKFL